MMLRQHHRTESGVPRTGTLRRVGSAFIWGVVPALALLCVATYFGAAVTRHVYPPAIPVEGISMQPLLHLGDLVLLEHADPTKLKKGDIIAFRTTPGDQSQYKVPAQYVHRIIRIQKGPGGLLFRTKGDNVTGPDPFWTRQQDVIGLYSGRVQKAGYPILFVRSKQGMILLGAVFLIALIYFAMGFFDRRAMEREVTIVEFASMVDEVRQLAGSMAGRGATAPRAPPLEIYDIPSDAATARTDDDVRETLRELVAAVSDYGQHLRSHTAVMQNLAATTAELHRATAEMRHAIRPTAAVEPAAPVLAPPATTMKQPAKPRRRLLLPTARTPTSDVDAVTARARQSLDELEQVLAALRRSVDAG
jgi:signal peptidase I